MTAFGKLIRTTAFRLTLVYLFLFALFAASLLGYFAWNPRRLITEQITGTVDAETSEISEIYARRGWTMFDQIDRVYDSAKAMRRLGFVCQTDFGDILTQLDREDGI